MEGPPFLMPNSMRKTGVVLSVLAVGLAFAPSATGNHASLPAAQASAATPTAPSLGLQTAASANWYSKSISASHYSSPAVVPVGPNKAMGVVDGFPDGTVQGWSLAGKHLWTFRTGHGAVQASPLIIDLNKDRRLD